MGYGVHRRLATLDRADGATPPGAAGIAGLIDASVFINTERRSLQRDEPAALVAGEPSTPEPAPSPEIVVPGGPVPSAPLPGQPPFPETPVPGTRPSPIPAIPTTPDEPAREPGPPEMPPTPATPDVPPLPGQPPAPETPRWGSRTDGASKAA